MLSLPRDLDSVDYRYQRAYVAAMMKLIARLFQAGSQVDDVIRKEVAEMPDGFLFRMDANPGTPCMLLQKRNGTMHVVPDTTPLEPALCISFKHVTHAFLVFSFQEGTAISFARDRMSIDGDAAMAMKIVRCLNRVQAVVLPKVIAARAVKTYPDLSVLDKLNVSTKTYSKLLINLVKEL